MAYICSCCFDDLDLHARSQWMGKGITYQRWIISTAKQAISIKLSTPVGWIGRPQHYAKLLYCTTESSKWWRRSENWKIEKEEGHFVCDFDFENVYMACPSCFLFLFARAWVLLAVWGDKTGSEWTSREWPAGRLELSSPDPGISFVKKKISFDLHPSVSWLIRCGWPLHEWLAWFSQTDTQLICSPDTSCRARRTSTDWSALSAGLITVLDGHTGSFDEAQTVARSRRSKSWTPDEGLLAPSTKHKSRTL